METVPFVLHFSLTHSKDVAFVVKAVEVEDEPGETFYRMAVVSKEGVPEFGPSMDDDAIFRKGPEFKEFFYKKRKLLSIP